MDAIGVDQFALEYVGLEPGITVHATLLRAELDDPRVNLLGRGFNGNSPVVDHARRRNQGITWERCGDFIVCRTPAIHPGHEGYHQNYSQNCESGQNANKLEKPFHILTPYAFAD